MVVGNPLFRSKKKKYKDVPDPLPANCTCRLDRKPVIMVFGNWKEGGRRGMTVTNRQFKKKKDFCQDEISFQK